MNILKDGKILLVSSQPSARSGIRKTLTDLGANNKSILVAGDWLQVKDALSKETINIVITDEEIGRNTGMELIDLHIQNNPSSRDRLFVLLINESSPFLLADFALRGGDIVLTKPFKNETFISTLSTALNSKEKMGKEEAACLDMQDALRARDMDRGETILSTFKNPKSFHAQYTRAIFLEASGDLEGAFDMFKNVVAQKVDFKSLVSIIRLGVGLKKHMELLKYVEMWLKDFPIHHASLPDITRVIIANRKFELLDEMFNIFSSHKINDNFAKIPLAAGFVMAASNHFTNGHKDMAKTYAVKGLEYSCRRMPIIVKAIEILMKAGGPVEAESAYLKFASEVNTVEDKISDIKIKEIIYPKSKVLVDCFKLLSQKVVHPELFQITISCMREIGKDPQEIIMQAKKSFPDQNFM